MKTIYYTLLLFLVCTGGFAQSMEITGTVSDVDGPVPGVSVFVKGTTRGTTTNFDGKYTIMANKGDVLVFSFLGYKIQEIKVKDNAVINVTLEDDEHTLDEVVILGYGSQKVMDKTGSISIMESREFNQTAGAPPAPQNINGTNIAADNWNTKGYKRESVKTKKQKLYIVDGVIINPSYVDLARAIPKSDISSKKELGKEKAKALYGDQAANGCIIITTIKGNYSVENDEAYASITENKFKHTELAPLSTFSIDVDKAGYSNIRRMINNGEAIPVDAVKIEEMINYFDYKYPQPDTKHPFAIQTDLAVTPWNPDTRLVRIGLQGKEIEKEALPASNLVFLIDVSGSMGGPNKLPMLKSAFKILVNNLREKDRVSIVVYAGAAGVVLEPTSGCEKEVIIAALNNLEAGGSTAGGEGIELAYDLASRNFIKNGNNRIILATDGDFNVGASSDEAMEELIEEKRKSGVFLSVLGFGMGNYKDSKLETLADKGNGNHAYVDTMQEAQLIFGKEFGGTLFTIAKDVKIQVEFNPALVAGYRLIGYENRLLNDEDFIDDTKDAGELGSGHSVTALYEIIPAGTKSDYLKQVNALKYSKKVSSTASGELMTVKFRYKKPDGDKSIEMTHILKNEVKDMSPDFSFVAAIGLFGMQLRKSSYIHNGNNELILALASAGKGEDKDGYRSEFIRLVNSAVKL